MPIHDWTRVEAFAFHGFHTRWLVHITELLNDGGLPAGYYADCEQIIHGSDADERSQPDLLTLHRSRGVFDAEAPAESTAMTLADVEPLAHRVPLPITPRPRKHVVIRHRSGHPIIAIIEVVSPANKDRLAHVEDFASKVAEALVAGIHVLVLDVFPPGRHDPNGLHEAILQQFSPTPYTLPIADGRTFGSSIGGPRENAYVEHPVVGDELPMMPLFLTPDRYVNVPLEASYQRAYRGTPAVWREVLEPPAGR